MFNRRSESTREKRVSVGRKAYGKLPSRPSGSASYAASTFEERRDDASASGLTRASESTGEIRVTFGSPPSPTVAKKPSQESSVTTPSPRGGGGGGGGNQEYRKMFPTSSELKKLGARSGGANARKEDGNGRQAAKENDGNGGSSKAGGSGKFAKRNRFLSRRNAPGRPDAPEDKEHAKKLLLSYAGQLTQKGESVTDSEATEAKVLDKKWKRQLSHEDDATSEGSSSSSSDDSDTSADEESTAFTGAEESTAYTDGEESTTYTAAEDDTAYTGAEDDTAYTGAEDSTAYTGAEDSTAYTNDRTEDGLSRDGSVKVGRAPSLSEKLSRARELWAKSIDDKGKEPTEEEATPTFMYKNKIAEVKAASPYGNGGAASVRSYDGADDSTAGSTMCKSQVTTLTDFMKMDALTVENRKHQLVMQVLEHGDTKKLLFQVSYTPKPKKPSDIVIKVECSTITLQDCMIRRGEWYNMPELPFVPGSDFVGIIHSMGEEAMGNSTFNVGDKVAAVVTSGGNAKYITMSYRNIMKVPPEVDSVVALCLSSVYVPARMTLDHARTANMPLTGVNVLVIGGNSPAGLAVIELALLEGARVFATADRVHHEFLSKYGAKCFPLDPSKWMSTLEGKMDVVIDSVALDGYESSHKALKPSGMMVCTGMSAVYTQGAIQVYGMGPDLRDTKAKYLDMQAKYVLSNTSRYSKAERYDLDLNEYAQHFRYLCYLAGNDSISPLVSTLSPLNLVPSVQKMIERCKASYGVCVCTPWITKADLWVQQGIKNSADEEV